jgi:hypothetical protein
VTATYADVKGTDRAQIDTNASNQGVGLAVSITTDANNDGVVNLAEINQGTTFTSRATFDNTKVAVGDKIVFTAKNGTDADVVVTHVLTAADLQTKDSNGKGFVDVTFTKPLEAAKQTVSVNFEDKAGNKAADTAPTDSAVLDTTPPSNDAINLGVQIITDPGPRPNGDGIVTTAELNNATDFTTEVTFDKTKTTVGHKIIVSAKNGNVDLPSQTVTVTLTQADVDKGAVQVKFAKPVDGQTQTVTAMYADQFGNADTTHAPTDFAKLDNSAPNGGIAPVVLITSDDGEGGAVSNNKNVGNNDGFLNDKEVETSNQVNVEVSFDKTKVAIDDSIFVTAAGVTKEFKLDTQAKIDAGKVVTSFDAPTTNGTELKVTAVIKDPVGNSTCKVSL